MVALALVAAGAAQRAAAADRTFTVTTASDTDDANAGDGICADANGACSLRAAVEEANALGGTTAIVLPAGTYTLMSGQLAITQNVALAGAGARTTTIDQTSGQRVLEVVAGRTTISGVTITGGNTITDGNEHNAGVGGGAYVDGSAELDLADATVSGNQAASSGGGIDSNGALVVVDSTIANNAATGSGYQIGGGIDDFGSSLSIVDSTIAGNTAGTQGGGVLAASDATLVNDTIAGNSSGSGGGVFVYGGSVVTTVNTILSGDTGGDCNAALASQGNNISLDPNCALTGAGDLAADALLGPLQDNGGGTDTLAPGAGSPALDAANSSYCPSADQIGTTRPAGHCDVGALQLTAAPAQPPPPPPPAPAPPPALPTPSVGAPAVTAVADTTATVGDSIDPNGSPTFYVVRWGTTAAYGEQTGAYAAGSGTSAQTVGVALQGLTPGTTYHVQVVATSPGGTAASADATFTTTGTGPATTPPPPPPPVQGQSFDAAPFSGTVLVNGRPLVAGAQIPFGSTVDATNGTVTLVSIGPTGQLQTASFTGAVFQVVQAADGSTELTLTGGDFGVCKVTRVRRTAGVDAKPRKPKKKGKRTPPRATKANTTVVRSLWGSGTGQFTTKGRYAAATVRGTVWHTADRCDGTSVTARTGVIAVLDLVTHKTIILTAPASYVAHP